MIKAAQRAGISLDSIGEALAGMGFSLVATRGTARVIEKLGVAVQPLRKIGEGPNVTDLMERGEVALIINTPGGKRPRRDEVVIRSMAVSRAVPCITTMAGARAAVRAIKAQQLGNLSVGALQDYAARPRTDVPATPSLGSEPSQAGSRG